MPDDEVGKSLHDKSTDAAAEGNDRNMPRFWVGEGEVAVSPQGWIAVDDPLTVGTQKPDAVLPGNGHELGLQPGTLLAHFAEAGRVDDDRLDPLFPALQDGLGDHRGRDDDMGQVNRTGNLIQGFIGLEAAYFRRCRVD